MKLFLQSFIKSIPSQELEIIDENVLVKSFLNENISETSNFDLLILTDKTKKVHLDKSFKENDCKEGQKLSLLIKANNVIKRPEPIILTEKQKRRRQKRMESRMKTQNEFEFQEEKK